MKVIAKIAVVYLDGYASPNSARNLRVRVPADASPAEVAVIIKAECGEYPHFGVAYMQPVYEPGPPVSDDYAREMSFRDNS